MSASVSLPGEMDGHGLAVLLLLNFHCRVRLPDNAQQARRALLLFLMDLIYQVVPTTASLDEFLSRIRTALACEPQQAAVVCEYLRQTLTILEVSDGLTKLFNEKLGRILPPYEAMGLMDTSEVFVDRRSFFGLHFRRMKLVFDSLDLEARGRLRDVALAWKQGCFGTSTDAAGLLVNVDERESLRIRAYKQYRLAMLTGDFATAKESMQKSFDYFAPGSDHELHQHTLLHLAAFHYQTGGTTASKAALDEAISLARPVHDHECIAMCESLMRRLLGEGSSKGLPEVRGPRDSLLSSQDVLWLAEQGITNGKNLVEVFQELSQSFRPPYLDSKRTRSSVEMSFYLMEDAARRFGKDAVPPDATLGQLWQDLDHADIADVYLQRANGLRSVVSITHAEARIKVNCRMAQNHARSGRYEAGLALLLRPATYEMLSLSEYHNWCEAVWDVLWLHATRRRERKTLKRLSQLDPGSTRVMQKIDVEDLVETPKAMQELLGSSGVAATLASVETDNSIPGDHSGPGRVLTARRKIELLLEKAQKLADHQPSLALSPALLAIALSRRQGYAALERAGIVVLSSVVAFGLKMPQHALHALEEALADEDLETRAVAQWTYAECMLASAGAAKTDAVVREAVLWLEKAEQDMQTISLIHLQRRVLYLLARLYHHLGDTAQRDQTSVRHGEVERDCLRATEAECPESLAVVEQVLEVVKLVGGHIGSGRAASIRLSQSRP